MPVGAARTEAWTNEEARFEVRRRFPWRDRGRPKWVKLWIGGEPLFDSLAGIGDFSGLFNQDVVTVGNARMAMRVGEHVELRSEAGSQRGASAIALKQDTPTRDRRAVPMNLLYPQPYAMQQMPNASVQGHAVLPDFRFKESDGPLFWRQVGSGDFGRLTGASRCMPGRFEQAIELSGRGPFAPALLPNDQEFCLPGSNYNFAFWVRSTEENTLLRAATRYSSYSNRVIERASWLVRCFSLKEPRHTQTRLNEVHWRHVLTTVSTRAQQLFVDDRLIATGNCTCRKTNSRRLGVDLGPGTDMGTLAMHELRVDTLPEPRN